MSGDVPNVLSIAGSDPSGGAGIQADLKTFAALEVYGCAVVTALTAQNTIEIPAVFPVPADFVRRQIDVLFADVTIHAVKIGMLGSAAVIREVAAALRSHGLAVIVLDPVLRASTGASLLDDDALTALREELLPLATVVTPNAHEVGILLGAPPPRSIAEARDAARALVGRGARAVLVSGGHVGDDAACVDVLDDGFMIHEFSVARITAPLSTHGTGCTLSSAIAAFMARGADLARACADGQLFVAESIARGTTLRVGHGVGPVHQLGDLWARADTLSS